MIAPKGIVLALLVVLSFVFVACDGVPGVPPLENPSEAQFTLAPGQKYTVAAPLRAGRTIEGTMSVSGPENFIDFYIRGPNGELSYGVVRVAGGHSFEMEAEAGGTYNLVFDNSFSFGSPRQITLRYSIR